MVNQAQLFLRKIAVVGLAIALFMGVIVARLAYLQITRCPDLLARSKRNFLRYEQTKPLRGNIVDRNGKLLATNRPVVNVYWKGSGSRTLTEQHKAWLLELEAVLGPCSIDEVALIGAERRAEKLLLAKDVPFDQLSKVAEQFAGHPTIIIETDFLRFYPYKQLASHILGYLGALNIGWSGKMGLEKLYEDDLRGECGLTQKVLNSFGKRLSDQEIQQPQAGQDIKTTLDLELQTIAESLFPADRKGMFLLMDATDGSLQVAFSRPDFDPNLFLAKLDEQEWQTIKEQKPFLNRIYNACYPPGSIFKLVTIAAALETGLIQEDTIWNCRGSVIVGNRHFHCNRKEGHGLLDTTASVAKSCNILFYKIAKHLDIDVLASYAQRFGLGQSAGTIFNDAPGLVPTRDWKRRTKGERWWLGETLSANIGQSYLLVTPIQIARLMASIEVGYLVTPRILEDSPAKHEPLAISPSTRLYLQKTTRAVAQDEGTGRVLAKLKHFEIGAKTSTAQTSMLEKRDRGEQFLEHGWVTVNFRYKQGHPMTLVILVEHAGQARPALLVARSFLKAYRSLMEQREKQEGAKAAQAL